jgi:hypothetical protein
MCNVQTYVYYELDGEKVAECVLSKAYLSIPEG